MKCNNIKPELGSPIHSPRKKDLSRRKFLQTAVAAGMVVTTVSIAGIAQTEQEEGSSRLEDPLEKALNRYGSEFGHLNRIIKPLNSS